MQVVNPLLDMAIPFEKESDTEEFPFTFEEMKWAAEASAECYKRIEKGEAKPLTFRK